MNFKRKVRASLIITIIWIILLNIIIVIGNKGIACSECSREAWQNCPHFSYLIPFIQMCGACCTPFTDVLMIWAIILFPAILYYLIRSLGEWSRKIK